MSELTPGMTEATLQELLKLLDHVYKTEIQDYEKLSFDNQEAHVIEAVRHLYGWLDTFAGFSAVHSYLPKTQRWST